MLDPLNHKNNVFGKNIIFVHIKILFKVKLNSSKIKCDYSCHYIKDYLNKIVQNITGIELGTKHYIIKKMFKNGIRISIKYNIIFS